MASDSHEMKVGGMTPREWARDVLTAQQASGTPMEDMLTALVERIHLTSMHEFAQGWLLAGSREAFQKQWAAAQDKRSAGRVN